MCRDVAHGYDLNTDVRSEQLDALCAVGTRTKRVPKSQINLRASAGRGLDFSNSMATIYGGRDEK